jgi:predicted Zn-dependent protease
VAIQSVWTGYVRWARNQISTTGETRDNKIVLQRLVNGAVGLVEINDTTDVELVAAARRAERLAVLNEQQPNSEFIAHLPLEPMTRPSLFSKTTYQLAAKPRAAAALTLIKQAAAVGMVSAGYIEVAAVSMSVLDTDGRVRYFPYTQARYSVTVRTPKGTGSGWAGLDHYDWAKIGAAQLTARALDKCLKSQNPVRVEPGRYTTILEPQAVCDLVGQLFWGPVLGAGPDAMNRGQNEGINMPLGPFYKSNIPPGYSKIGERIVDERITISADPMDPEMGFPPMTPPMPGVADQFMQDVYHPSVWIDRGVLVNLAYPRNIGRLASNPTLGRVLDLGMPNSGAFRMSGGTTSIEEMIATTKRGLLVTRFDNILQLNFTSQLYRGYTRDGLWLIENGKITKPAQNLAFTESPLFALNKIEQLGVPQRAFHPNLVLRYAIPQPVVVPPLKVSDFSFTALSDAV